MKLFVNSYVEEENCHECTDEQGKVHRVDLRVDDATIGADAELVGKFVQVDYLYPHLEIAMNVRVMREGE